jgi:hypothetical protein
MIFIGDDAVFLLALRRSRGRGDGRAEAAISVLRICAGLPAGPLSSSVGEKKSPFLLTARPNEDINSSWDAIPTD